MRDDGNLVPETWRSMDNHPARYLPAAIGELEVLILADTTDLQRVASGVWKELSSFCISQGLVQAPVTEEELINYFQTAVVTRVQHVRHLRRDIRVEDHWALPFPLQYIANAIGEVRLESPSITILPTLGSKVGPALSRTQWQDITVRLLSLETRGLRLAHAIEAKREGVARVMSLTIGVDGAEWIAYSHEPFKPYDALTAKAAGLSPVDPAMATLPANPLWRPPYFMYGRELVVFEQRFMEISVSKAS
jgi:hypothetical protein